MERDQPDAGIALHSTRLVSGGAYICAAARPRPGQPDARSDSSAAPVLAIRAQPIPPAAREGPDPSSLESRLAAAKRRRELEERDASDRAVRRTYAPGTKPPLALEWAQPPSTAAPVGHLPLASTGGTRTSPALMQGQSSGSADRGSTALATLPWMRLTAAQLLRFEAEPEQRTRSAQWQKLLSEQFRGAKRGSFVPYHEYAGTGPKSSGAHAKLLCGEVAPPEGWRPRVHHVTEVRDLLKRGVEARRLAPAIHSSSWERALQEPWDRLLLWPRDRLLSVILDYACGVGGPSRLAAIRCQLVKLDEFNVRS